MTRCQLAQLLAAGRIDERYLAVEAVCLAATAQNEQLAVGREGRGRDVLLERRRQVALHLPADGVPELDTCMAPRIEDQWDAFRDQRLLGIGCQCHGVSPAL